MRDRPLVLAPAALLAAALVSTAIGCGSDTSTADRRQALEDYVSQVQPIRHGINELLDKADPSRVLARSREPLIRPEPGQRQGYVPNVVYTCGATRHHDKIILPYAVSDTFCTFASIGIADLLASMDG